MEGTDYIETIAILAEGTEGTDYTKIIAIFAIERARNAQIILKQLPFLLSEGHGRHRLY
jgi:hypothetical protein